VRSDKERIVKSRDKGAALLKAVERGDHAALKRLIDDGAPVEARDPVRRATALLHAVRRRDIDAIAILVAAGADINAQDNIKDSAFLLAGALGDAAILKALLDSKSDGAKPDFTKVNRYGGSALIPAAERGHVAVVKRLIAAGVPVDHVNRLGWTALLEAIILSDGGKSHQQIVKALIAAGADVNLPDGDGVTPLQHARTRGYAAIASLLQDAGAR
jgi:ankyrin repeat protein